MRIGFVAAGVVAFLVGLVWALQGADVLLGSSMSGNSFWLGAGVVLLIVGLVLAGWGTRSVPSKKAAPGSDQPDT
ncbi:MAG TPA: hypothetical protein HA326_07165 [Thermoplasmata archaeon]|nr:hypothetical protein [Thermoplasmata archaeon]